MELQIPNGRFFLHRGSFSEFAVEDIPHKVEFHLDDSGKAIRLRIWRPWICQDHRARQIEGSSNGCTLAGSRRLIVTALWGIEGGIGRSGRLVRLQSAATSSSSQYLESSARQRVSLCPI